MTHQSAVEVPTASLTQTYRILDVELRIRTDDAGLLSEFASVFGGDEPGVDPPRAAFEALVEANIPGDLGRLEVQGDGLQDPGRFLLGFASPTIPLRELESPRSDTLRVGLADQPDFAFEFSGESCRFRKLPRWRRILSHFLFLRLLRLRSDVLCLHAASLGIGEKGLLLIGPKGAGKSTLSAALAARGHAFLGDEIAAYQSSSGLLLPSCRPLGIKPGPRAAAIERALAALRPAPDEEGLLRVSIGSLVADSAAARPVPLRAVLFLEGFAAKPDLRRVEAGRDELSRMQPLASSLAHGATGRVFEMVRLLGSAASYRLRPGDPDETADLLEEVFTES